MLGRHIVQSGHYCGPTALMLLTGIKWERLRRRINLMRGRKEDHAIAGMHRDELLKYLEIDGVKIADKIINVVPVVLNHYRSAFKGYWLIESSKHFMAVVDNRVADNHYVKWTPIDRSKQRLRKLLRAWKLENA